MIPVSWAPYVGIGLGLLIGAPLLWIVYYLIVRTPPGSRDRCAVCGWERDIHHHLHDFEESKRQPPIVDLRLPPEDDVPPKNFEP
jgi:hypothetical protein